MNIADLISKTEGANITIAIGLKDLREWHQEIVEDSRRLMEQSIQEKSEEEYLSTAEVCKLLSISRASLSRWQNKEYLIPARVGGKCKYRKSEIQSILNSKNRT